MSNDSANHNSATQWVEMVLNLANGHTGAVLTLAYSLDGKFLVSGSEDTTVKVWDISSANLYTTLEGHTGAVQSVIYSNRNNIIVRGSEDQTIIVWDIVTGSIMTILSGHKGTIYALAISPSKNILASGSEDQTIKLWDLNSYQLVTSLHAHSASIGAIAFSPDGKVLASGAEDQLIKIWDIEKMVTINTLNGHKSSITALAFSPDGKILASGSEDQTIKCWDVVNGNLLFTLNGHTDSVQSMVFNSTAEVLITGSVDRTIKFWDIQSHSLIFTLKGHKTPVESIVLSPDGKILASGSLNSTIKLWDIDSRRLLLSLKSNTGATYAATLNPTGELLATSGNTGDNSIKIWGLTSGALQNTFEGQNEQITGMTFIPGKEQLISVSESQTTSVWDYKFGKLIDSYTKDNIPVSIKEYLTKQSQLTPFRLQNTTNGSLIHCTISIHNLVKLMNLLSFPWQIWIGPLKWISGMTLPAGYLHFPFHLDKKFPKIWIEEIEQVINQQLDIEKHVVLLKVLRQVQTQPESTIREVLSSVAPELLLDEKNKILMRKNVDKDLFKGLSSILVSPPSTTSLQAIFDELRYLHKEQQSLLQELQKITQNLLDIQKALSIKNKE